MAEPLSDLVARYAGSEAEALYDESVTEREHALQCGALARAAGVSDELVAAALLHDVGHLVVKDLARIDVELTRDHHHERAGARFLSGWFGPEVTEPVRLHVAAKRYLCATEADYGARLSPSSVRSLAVQGGPMSADEVEAFEREPHFAAALQVRRWDDEAKVTGLDVAPFDSYRPLLDAVAR